MVNSLSNTLYGQVDSEVIKKARAIKLLVCDIDGVFSDGRIYLGNNGEELKAFNTKDGFGMKAITDNGITTAVITGRKSAIVENRMKALNVSFIVQGKEDKLPALQQIAHQLNLSAEQIAYIGDDVPDIACIEHVGLGVAVNDAHPSVKNASNYITFLNGGCGAVRELCDLIMQSQNTLQFAKGSSI